MNKILSLLCISLLAIFGFTGCLGLHFGGGTKTDVQNRSQTYDVTLGQQLLDLQKAYDAGVITQSEYNSQKRKLLHYYLHK
jgi:hypothetical protein